VYASSKEVCDSWEDLVIPSFDEDWDEDSDVVFVDQDGELEPTVVAKVLRYEGHVSPARNEFWYFRVHNLLEDKEETYFILEEFGARPDTLNFPPRPPNLVPPPSPFDGYEPPPRLATMQEDVDCGEYVLSECEEHANSSKPQDKESEASWLGADLENPTSVSEEVLSKEALKAKVEELSKPVPQGSVILAKALVSRKGSEVLMALQEIVVQLEQYGLFVSKVHTDRAREFLSYKRVRSWLASKGIARSFTSGIEPAANGSGESAVKWVKRRVRQLLVLISSKAPASQWPAAMQWAVTKQIREKLPVGDPNIPPFHAKVGRRIVRVSFEHGVEGAPESMILGGYVQGGFKGATKETLRRPHLTKFLNEFLRDHLEQQGLHGRGLWISDSTLGEPVDMLLPTGHEQEGSKVPIDGQAVTHLEVY
ncbi:unnamed protein product, partial [Symbiodinium necroappetens]